MKILIAEDEPSLRENLQLMLEMDGDEDRDNYNNVYTNTNNGIKTKF